MQLPTNVKIPNNQERKAFPIASVKVDGESGIVEAIVAVFGNIDHGGDIIHPGAFAKTIAERFPKREIYVLDNHNSWSARDAVALLLEIREVGRNELPAETLINYPDATGGLYTRAQYMLDDEISAGIFRRIRDGVINKYSIGFSIIKQDMSSVQTDEGEVYVRNLREVKLYEFSPVVFAMNTATATVGAKNAAALQPDEGKEASGYRAAVGSAACAKCMFYRPVTDDLGYCKAHDMACQAGYVCDTYERSADVLPTLGDLIRDRINADLQRMLEDGVTAGWFGDSDEEMIRALMSDWVTALADIVPSALSERTVEPRVYQLPKREDVELDGVSEAEPRTGALTSTSEEDGETRRKALLESLKLQAAMMAAGA